MTASSRRYFMAGVSVLVELVQATTRDGFRLDGSFRAATGPSSIGVDGLCFVHGTGGNFYNSTLFDVFAERFLPLGCAILRVNTRGHDGISTAAMTQGGKRLGAAYEVVDDCRHDITAWHDWLVQRVGPRIGLVGHSLGAVKCIYALAHDPQLTPKFVIGLSPPRLSYSVFCASAQAREFVQTYTQAERHMLNGHPGTLMEVKLPLSFVISAAGYVEKYGPDERYNFLKFIPSLKHPTLITYGSIECESNMAFRGVPEALQGSSDLVRVETIAGADHFYSGVRPALVDCVANWLQGLPA